MEGKRGFEIVSTWKDAGISLPRRKTAMSAGYDIESAVETEVLPGEIKVIPTGLKAYMESDGIWRSISDPAWPLNMALCLQTAPVLLMRTTMGMKIMKGILCVLYIILLEKLSIFLKGIGLPRGCL